MKIISLFFGKKAQVTVFIILGLFLLIGVGLFTYFRSEVYKYHDLPEQFIPVAKYAEECVQDIAQQGIFQAGMQGGYVYLPFRQDAAYLNIGFPVTYLYLAGENRAVSIVHLEKDLNTYIAENINNCLSDFSVFNQFTFTPVATVNVSVATSVSSDTVEIDLEMPVHISDATTTATLPTIKVSFDNTIGKKIFLAYQIMKTENEQGFLEYYTNEIIAASDWLPYEGFDFTCAPKRWKVDDMRSYIEKAVAVNLPYIMFDGTDFDETGNPYYDNIYKVSLGASGVSDLKVTTSYDPRWGMDLDVQPSRDGIVTDVKLVGKTIALPCIHTYHHKYSTNYPVLFTITDGESTNYPFYFATPVIMHRNQADRKNEMQPWPSEADTIREKAFCANETTTVLYTLDSEGRITTQEQEQKNWNYGLDVVAMDNQYGFDAVLDEVSISYHCLNFNCPVGETAYGGGTGRFYGSSGMFVTYPLLSSTFPTCLNGELIAEKEGYQTKTIFQSVSEETDGATVLLPLYRLQPLSFDVIVVQNHNNIISERGLKDNEMAVITVKNSQEGFEKVLVYPTTEGATATTETLTSRIFGTDSETETVDSETLAAAGFDTLSLMIGDDLTYNVDVKLIQDDRYVGSFVYNWTLDANAVSGASHAQFYVIKKDVLVPTDENYSESIKYADSESSSYPPILS